MRNKLQQGKKMMVVIVAMAIMLAFAQKTSAESLIPRMATKQISMRDSIKVGEDYCRYTVQIELPMVDGPVRDSINAFVCAMLDQENYDNIEKAFKKTSKEYFDNYRKETEEAGGGLPWYYEMEIGVTSYCSQYITMSVVGYDYLGGAHGMPFDFCVTFLTSNGKRLGWKDFTSRGEFMRPTISKALDPDLFDDPTKIKPLPARTPWLKGTMLVFKYCPYEITSFAGGMPEAEVHFTKLEEYLKPEIVELCKAYYKEDTGMEYGTGPDFEGETEARPMLYNELDADFMVNGTPNIRSFVEATLGSLGYEFEPENYDLRNGYFQITEEGDGMFRVNAAYWNRNDGKKLFIISWDNTGVEFADKRTGECRGVKYASSPWMHFDVENAGDGYYRTEESGYLTYIFNEKTRMLELKYDISILGNLSEFNGHRYLILPQKGKDIKVMEKDGDGNCRYRTLRWNGMSFRDGLHSNDD